MEEAAQMSRIRSKRWLAIIAVLAVAIVAGAGLVVASASDDDDEFEQSITGVELERASEAALKHTGGGRVTDTEVGDEEGYYEVEVTLDNGDQVDVHLDENFNVLSAEDDGDDEDD
jgi:uncharacterized membrane protein YkoI